MVVLSRKVGEKIIISTGDDRVEVVVLAVSGHKVRLGIVAGPHVSVHRSEVQERIEAEQRVLSPDLGGEG